MAVAILAITLVIAIPTFANTVRSATTAKDTVNLQALAADALSIARSQGQTVPTALDYTIAAGEMPALTSSAAVHYVLTAAGNTFTFVNSTQANPNPSSTYGQVSLDVTDSPVLNGLATLSQSGGCILALVQSTGVTSWQNSASSTCSGYVALAGAPAGRSATSTTTVTSSPLVAPAPTVANNTPGVLSFAWPASLGGTGTTTYYWSLSPSVSGCTGGSTTALSVTCTSSSLVDGATYTFSLYAQDSSGTTTPVTSISTVYFGSSTTTTTTASTTTTTTASTTTTTVASSASPLNVLSSQCTNPSFEADGPASVTQNGTTGVLSIGANCANSVTDLQSSLNAGQIDTTDSGLNTYCYKDSPTAPCASGVTGPVESYQPSAQDPYSSLTAPSNPTSDTYVTCSLANGVTCPAGHYASTLTISANNSVTFACGTTIFDYPVVVKNYASVTFDCGTYWFRGGLYAKDHSTVTFGNGTYLFGDNSIPGNCDTNSCLQIVGAGSVSSTSSGTLLYVEDGSTTIDTSGSIRLGGCDRYQGLSIWSASGSGTTNPVTISNSGTANDQLGGVYSPSGNVVISGDGNVHTTGVTSSTAATSAHGSHQIGD